VLAFHAWSGNDGFVTGVEMMVYDWSGNVGYKIMTGVEIEVIVLVTGVEM